MNVSKAQREDLSGLLSLYTQLHDNPVPQNSRQLLQLWDEILSDKNHYCIVGKEDGVIVSSCVLLIVPNLTHCQRPYALIENVVTDKDRRGRGFGTQVLNYARDIAVSKGCYKIMLMTGSKQQSTLDFYKRAGYNDKDKTAFICWL